MGILSWVIKIVAIFLIILVALLDLSLNIISFIPYIGDALETAGEIVLEIIQFLAFGLLAISRGKFGLKDILMIAVFGVISLMDVALNVVSLIPGIGDLVETLGEVVLEMLQVLLAFMKIIL